MSENFPYFFNRMSITSSELSNIIDYIKEEIKLNPEDSFAKTLLKQLGNLELKMIDGQMEFVSNLQQISKSNFY